MNQIEVNLENRNWKNQLCLECLGVGVGFRSNHKAFISALGKRLPEILPILWKEIPPTEVKHWFSVLKGGNSSSEFRIYKDSEYILTNVRLKEIIGYLETQIRSIIAEYARDFIFLHAGAVSWKGKGIIIPGKTFSGKTTLVSELIKRNCEYLSDEFAVIDREGFVHPFPKKLSMRGIIDDYRQVDLAVEEFGGKSSKIPVPIKYFLVTEYNKQKKKPRIKIESIGEGVLAGVANSISVRQNPKFVLEVLSVVAGSALIFKTKRGNAAEFAEYFLDFLEKIENSDHSGKNNK